MAASGKKTILLVEDEALIALAEARTIGEFGYNIVTANSGERAVEIAFHDPSIKLILMDIDLGKGLDGPQAAQRILEKRTLPIVFLTSHSERETVEKVRGITRYGYVIKNSGDFVLRSSLEMAFDLFEAHESSREREERLSRAEGLSGFGSWEFDLTTKTVKASEGARRIYGLTAAEWTIPAVQRIPLPEYRAALDAALTGLVERNLPYDVEFKIRRPSDDCILHIHSIASYDSRRNVVTGTIQDVTERKRTEEILKSSNEKYFHLFEAESDAIFLVDDETGRIQEANSAAVATYGYSREELLSKRNVDMSAEPDRTRKATEDRDTYIPIRWHKKKDGTVFPVEISASHIAWNGRPAHIAAIRDVTERKRTEDALMKSRTLLQEMSEIAKIGGWRFEAETQELQWTDEIYAIYEVAPTTVPSMGLALSCYAPKALPVMKEAIRRLMESGEPFDLELEFVTTKGSSRWVRAIGRPLFSDGKITGRAGTLQDITAQKYAEALFRREKERLQNVVAATNVGTWEWNVRTGEVCFDEKTAGLLGYTLDELRPGSFETWRKLRHPDDLKASDDLLERHLRGETEYYSFESRMRHKNGSWIWVYVRSTVVERDESGKPLRLFVLHRDITELKRTEEALRRNAEIQTVLREITEAAVLTPTMEELYGVVYRLVGRVLPARLFHINLLDEKAGEIVVPFRADDVNFIPTRRPVDKGLTEYVMRLGRAVYVSPDEMARLRETGEYTLANVQNAQVRHYLGAPLIDSRGKAFGVMSLILMGEAQTILPEDVEVLSIIAAQVSMAIERKRAEETLRESEEKHRRLIENSHDIIYTLTADGLFTFVSSAWTELLGHEVSQVTGRPFQPFIHPDDLTACLSWLQKVTETGKRREGIEYRVRHADGTFRWHSSSAVPIKDAAGKTVGIEGMARDITERKTAEEKIRALLEEKELLLKEVHHRIKNNMSVMSSLLSLQSNTVTDPAAVAALQDAKNRLSSMGVLYERLYHSENLREMSVRDYLPPLIDHIVRLFPNGKEVEIEERIEDFVLGVKELSSLGIIVNELLTNTMKHAFIGRNEKSIFVTASKEKNRAVVAIGDDGIGLPEGVDPANSTGFGLMLVGTLAKQLKGTLRIERERGTKFILEFEA